MSSPGRHPARPAAGAPEVRAARLLRRAAWISAAASLAALALSAPFGLAVLAGATVSTWNMHLLRRAVRSLTGARTARTALTALALTVGRHLLLGVVLAAIIGFWNADVIGVVCGLGAPLLAILPELSSAGRAAFRTASPGALSGDRPVSRPSAEAERAGNAAARD